MATEVTKNNVLSTLTFELIRQGLNGELWEACDHIADLTRYAMLPGISEDVVGKCWDIMCFNKWEPVYNTKPKNTYKPHSFQPAKGEAPRSCNPNSKTVAKNRAKNKAAKAARKKS